MQLLKPLALGKFELKNRVVMAPLARARGDALRAPKDIVATYYAQRVSAGLIITEANHISTQSATRARATAHHTDHQNSAWEKVTKEVHRAGGIIFQQLYHVGRKSLLSSTPGREPPIAPSALSAFGGIMSEHGLEEFPVPRALELSEIQPLVEDYRRSVVLARQGSMASKSLREMASSLISFSETLLIAGMTNMAARSRTGLVSCLKSSMLQSKSGEAIMWVYAYLRISVPIASVTQIQERSSATSLLS